MREELDCPPVPPVLFKSSNLTLSTIGFYNWISNLDLRYASLLYCGTLMR